MPDKISVLLVDDHSLVRRGFRRMLADESDMNVVGEASDGQEAVPLIRNKTEIVRDLQHYYKNKKRYSYAGVYSYPYDVFAPGRCSQMQVQVFSEEDIETPINSDVSEATKNRVWLDFQDFRTHLAKSQRAEEPR